MRRRKVIKPDTLFTAEMFEKLGISHYEPNSKYLVRYQKEGFIRFKNLFPKGAKFTLENVKKFMGYEVWRAFCFNDLVEALIVEKRVRIWHIFMYDFDFRYDWPCKSCQLYAEAFYRFATGEDIKFESFKEKLGLCTL